MLRVGIEEMNIYSGLACVDVREVAEYRNLDLKRFDNLMIHQKSVALPFEDPITHAVNAAFPITNKMKDEERNKIDLLIVCSESGIDFSKSISTYVHDYLKLSRHCRLFEIKQACYSGTAGLQTAAAYSLSQASRESKALVITTDISHFLVAEGDQGSNIDWDFAEPSGGAGAVAMLISNTPDIFELDINAFGLYSHEVMDTCRPIPDKEAGNADLSLVSYLNCCKQAYEAYQKKVGEADYRSSFQYLAFHTPFAGMIKGAHRTMMRHLYQMHPAEIENDFQKRVSPGLDYCQRVGNIMGGSLYLSLAGILANATIDSAKRIGCFSYGSGCASEFFSGVCTPKSQAKIRKMLIDQHIRERYKLSVKEYLSILSRKDSIPFGTEKITLNKSLYNYVKKPVEMEKRLYLDNINNFHRKYIWS